MREREEEGEGERGKEGRGEEGVRKGRREKKERLVDEGEKRNGG